MTTPSTWANDGLINLLPVGFPWATQTIVAVLVLQATWVPDKSDPNLASVFGDGAVEMTAAPYVRQTLTGLVVNPDATNHKSRQVSSAIAFGSLASGSDYDTLLLALDGATDSDRTLLFTVDVSDSGAPRTTDGNPVNCIPDPGALWDLISA